MSIIHLRDCYSQKVVLVRSVKMIQNFEATYALRCAVRSYDVRYEFFDAGKCPRYLVASTHHVISCVPYWEINAIDLPSFERSTMYAGPNVVESSLKIMDTVPDQKWNFDRMVDGLLHKERYSALLIISKS